MQVDLTELTNILKPFNPEMAVIPEGKKIVILNFLIETLEMASVELDYDSLIKEIKRAEKKYPDVTVLFFQGLTSVLTVDT